MFTKCLLLFIESKRGKENNQAVFQQENALHTLLSTFGIFLIMLFLF